MSDFAEALRWHRERDRDSVSLRVPHEFEVVPDEVWELTPRVLSVQGRFRSLGNGVGRCGAVRELRIASPLLEELPGDIGDLVDLESLEIVADAMVELPESFQNLGGLNVLELVVPSLRELPAGIVKLQGLAELELTGTAFETMPREIFELKGLVALTMLYGALVELPAELARLDRLGRLELVANEIRTLPDLSGLPQLKVLDLNQNPIQSIHPSVTELEHLRSFWVDDDAKSLLPDDFWETVDRRRDLHNATLRLGPRS